MAHAYHPQCPCSACGDSEAADERIEADVANLREAVVANTREARQADEAIRNAFALCGGAP